MQEEKRGPVSLEASENGKNRETEIWRQNNIIKIEERDKKNNKRINKDRLCREDIISGHIIIYGLK